MIDRSGRSVVIDVTLVRSKSIATSYILGGPSREVQHLRG